MNFNKKRIVITGGAGFIGSALAHHFDEHYPEASVLVVDKFRNDDVFSNGNLKSFGHFKNLLGFKGEVFAGDINSKKTLEKIECFKPEIIFHEAAISDTTVKEQDELIKTNVNAFVDLLEICQKYDIKMVYASSGATYGNAKSPQKVGECEAPNNAYGFSKLAMDNIGRKYAQQGVHVVGLRYFNVYGKGEFFKNKTASMVLQFGLQILAGKTPRLFEGSDNIKRDFVYIKDIIDANLKAVSAKSGVYNAATGTARSFQDIADILQKELGTNLGNEYIPNPFVGSYQFHTEADMSVTKAGLGFESKWSLEDGVADYIGEIKRIFKEELNG
ncbi:ADP-glyceromanno-heptose 6-epimerase [Campylobacter suis]|uniref:ADP-L-glycero-D-manno-heptose-6-epimerase n=1 Tax=Campylobacter suis TaxID=2790657 RepID=A0ABN7K4C4_9BACT|nr:ADP-glyceromanno-heptose 6-epimerase [Campylobacter suis]CAD7287391.1 ADP-L-glycero-D-manno-heptose-6-epimerase [Campylobacter suis]